MSGGFIKPQKEGHHQVVIFTFIGQMSQAEVDQWNQAVKNLKKQFGANLVGVSIIGEATPKED